MINNKTSTSNEHKNINKNNNSKNHTKNDLISNIDNNLDQEETEEDIIFQTNSCFDEQSFYKSIKDSINEETGFSKLSNNIFSNLYKNNNQINNNPQNFDNLLNADKYYSSGSKLKNKKIIKDFIERNNYVKNREYEEYENSEEEKEEENSNNDNKKYNNYKKFQNFLYREKRFQIRLDQNRERKLKLEDEALMNNIKLKPNICQKSSILANKKNKNTKVYQRLYQSPNYSTFGSNNKYQFKEDENNKIANINNINKSLNFSASKYTSRKSKKDIKSLSSNNFYNKNEVKKNKNEFINKNNETPKKTKDKLSLSKKYSRKSTKSSNKIKPKEDYFTINASKSINKAKSKSKKKIKQYDIDKLFNKYNNQSANDKMKIFELRKINLIIDDLLSKRNIKKENKITFYLFCELLFELGFVYIFHKKKDNSEINKEYIKVLTVQQYKDKSLMTKEIIYNELLIINNAFNSIINNFKPKKDLNIIEKNNNKGKINNNEISVEEFKLFIFILTDIFEGYEKDNKIKSPRGSSNNIMNKNNKYNSSLYSNKSNKGENASNKEKIKSNNAKINNIISKIIPNINLNAFSNKDIIYYKNYFKYMKDVNKEYIIFYNNERKNIKKDNLEKNILYPFTFVPKTNNNNDLILDAIKPNMNFEERNNIISKKKEKEKMEMINQLNNDLLQELTFSPKLNRKTSTNYFKRVNKMIEKEKKEKEEKEKRKKELNNIKNINNNINVIEPENSKETNNINNRYNSFNKEKSEKLSNKKISNLRKFNFMKKLNNFENNNREVLNDDIKKDKRFLNYLLNNADEGRMNMGIERKSNKDTFDIFDETKKKNKNKINNEKGYKSNVADILNSKNKYPLFEVEIKIKNENYNIEVFPKDNYENVCLNFCKEHGLGVESYNQILESINKKIKEIDGYSISLEKDNKK